MDLPIVPPAAASPPVTLAHPVVQAVPVVFASPHSGRDYPAEFVAAARLDALALRRSEDGFVDELFATAPDHGAPLLAATFPRAFCDANREAWELDPAMFEEDLPPWVNTASARVSAGLGTIARVVSSGESIYRRKLRFAEAERRIRLYWEPFHAALRELIEETRRRFGVCLLVDCHSMPGNSTSPAAAADFVLGDAHGTACAPRVLRAAEEALGGLGYRVRRNDPYAGGFITRHYGRPREGVHAVQVEICRPLYMDEARMEKLPAFTQVQQDVTTMIVALTKAGAQLRTR
ncbi:N-formylglutamate amidohydrolase [Rhodovastum atsumiense]|uniref:N-formylglutamate amidohydrolase n=1 Tax=Rhodovastum atsumiense TaxID=504468 RepID=A0A5M6IY58_9PROT|nr:N-formylglutamate amidohydrolase [Rhodovastum atsumiense]KAA5612308.1 N-formylglutamate amidohydrolase [Rhodovastum atsumiense]CAH2601637.1 N-formylglutamate amidohydrolase [Rhodovastum atsumiense]